MVVDLGTGTGIFALLACRFGARRVYAIEPDDAIQVAKEIAAANHCADRIEFVQAMSTDVDLPERADVIVSDIGGMLPWFQKHIPAIADARRRFLAPGGRLIPLHDTAWAAVVAAPELYERQCGPWRENEFGLDMEAARRLVTNVWSRGSVNRDQLLTEPQQWATLDYAQVEDPDVSARIDWSIERAGTAHGIAAGFDRIVSDGVRLSNAPTPETESASKHLRHDLLPLAGHRSPSLLAISSPSSSRPGSLPTITSGAGRRPYSIAAAGRPRRRASPNRRFLARRSPPRNSGSERRLTRRR